jgi:hypothetical protein
MDEFAQRLLAWYDRTAATTCPGSATPRPTTCGSRRSCCSRPRSPRLSPTTNASPRAFPTSRTWPRRRHRRGTAPLERPGLLRPGAQPAQGGARSSSRTIAANSPMTSTRCRPCRASALDRRRHPVHRSGRARSRSSTATSSACWHATTPSTAGRAKRAWPGALGARRAAHAAERVADYTQAIMDLGATLCTRSSPACERCPQAMDCRRRPRDGRRTSRVKAPGAADPCDTKRGRLIHAGAELFLERRPPAGSGAGCGAFPRSKRGRGQRLCSELLAGKGARPSAPCRRCATASVTTP